MRRALVMIALCSLWASPVRAQELGLKAALSEARSSNEEWEVARVRIARARAAVRQAKASFYPTFGLDASVTRNPEEVLIGDRVIQPLFNWSASASGGLTLYDGTRYAQIRRAQASLQEEVATAAWRKATIEFEVRRAWYVLATAQAQVGLVDDILALRRQDLKRAEALVAGERAVPLDVARARADLLATEQRRLELELARRNAADALTALLGRSGGKDVRVVSLDAVPWTSRLGGAELEARADFVARSRAIDAAQKAEEAGARVWLPRLDLGANALLGPATLTRPDGFFWSITLSATWVVYDGGVRDHVLDQLSAERRELELRREQQLRAERVEVMAARRTFEVAVASRGVLLKRLENAQDALKLARKRFGAGVASSLEVRDATEQVLQARQAQLNNRLSAALAAAQHAYLAGRARP